MRLTALMLAFAMALATTGAALAEGMCSSYKSHVAQSTKNQQAPSSEAE